MESNQSESIEATPQQAAEEPARGALYVPPERRPEVVKRLLSGLWNCCALRRTAISALQNLQRLNGSTLDPKRASRDFKPPISGTLITADQDVMAMDATIPYVPPSENGA